MCGAEKTPKDPEEMVQRGAPKLDKLVDKPQYL